MAVSILDVIAEEVREGIIGDTNFYKSMPWLFRIVVDGESFKGPTGYDGTALFPLPMAPTKFDYDLPFAAELTPQQEGGVVAERAGIVLGTITMSGTTGWKLRTLNTRNEVVDPKFTSGLVGNQMAYKQQVSGQWHFWILANQCFEGYSELMKDPELAAKTRMELHVMKDALHLEVEPVTFCLTRNAAQNCCARPSPWCVKPASGCWACVTSMCS